MDMALDRNEVPGKGGGANDHTGPESAAEAPGNASGGRRGHGFAQANTPTKHSKLTRVS